MTVQQPGSHPTPEPEAELGLDELVDDVEGHGMKEVIAGLGAAAVLGTAGAAAAGISTSPGAPAMMRPDVKRTVRTVAGMATQTVAGADETAAAAAGYADRAANRVTATAVDATDDAAALAREAALRLVSQDGRAATATTVRSDTLNAVLGEEVEITALVTPAAPDVAAPTGLVTFWSGDSRLGTSRLAPDGSATIGTRALASGVHQVVAKYAGDSAHAPSTSLPSPQIVVRGVAEMSRPDKLSVSTGDALPGSVTLTLTLGSENTGSLSGTVVFRDGEIVLGSAEIREGQAVLTVSGLAAGTHRFTVTVPTGVVPLASLTW